jgi:hypothetical protein
MCAEKTEYILTQDSMVLRRTTDTEITNADQLISAVFNQRGCVIAHAAVGTHLRTSANLVWVASRLKRIVLRTRFDHRTDPSGAPIVVPAFTGEATNPIPLSPNWTPPESMHLYLISAMANHVTVTREANTSHACFLVAYDMSSSRRGQFLLPLPNVHGDGKLCMGDEWERRGRLEAAGLGGYIERHAAALRCFLDSSWNSDLSDGKLQGAVALFSFDGAGVQLPCQNEWTNLCTRAGSTNYDWVYDILKAT